MGLESRERTASSETADSDCGLKDEPQYESKPAPTSEVTYKEYFKFPGDDHEDLSDMETDEDRRKFIKRTVKLTDKQFAKFMLQDIIQRKKI